MRRDPLDARRDALIADGLDAALEIDAARPAWPALVAMGIDPQRLVDDLRAMSERARVAVEAAERAVVDAGRPFLAAAPVLEQARAWQQLVRRLLNSRLPAGMAAELAGADLRATIGATAHRVAGTCTMLRSAVEILTSRQSELGAEVAATGRTAAGLLARLEEIERQHYAARLARRQRAAEAAEHVMALRQRLREVRRELALVRVGSGVDLPVLSLAQGRADVAQRKRRRPAEE